MICLFWQFSRLKETLSQIEWRERERTLGNMLKKVLFSSQAFFGVWRNSKATTTRPRVSQQQSKAVPEIEKERVLVIINQIT